MTRSEFLHQNPQHSILGPKIWITKILQFRNLNNSYISENFWRLSMVLYVLQQKRDSHQVVLLTTALLRISAKYQNIWRLYIYIFLYNLLLGFLHHPTNQLVEMSSIICKLDSFIKHSASYLLTFSINLGSSNLLLTKLCYLWSSLSYLISLVYF